MRRVLFFLIIILHALIHLLGVVQAFHLAEIKELAIPVSEVYGILWGLALVLMLIAGLQYILKKTTWWMTGFAAVVVSQLLTILVWQEAKFATIPNALILLLAIIAFSDWNFNRQVSREVRAMFAKAKQDKDRRITKEMIAGLPAPVQRWLEQSGIIGKQAIHTVRLKQHAWMKMKPGQEKWSEAKAAQYFTVQPPAFLWAVRMQMMPGLHIAGRDKFEQGKGAMLIKLLALFPVVNACNNQKIDTGTLQRFLGEIVWFPSAALSPYISWEQKDDRSAVATMTYEGTTGEGTFYFDENGLLDRFEALRYRGGEETAELKPWIIKVHRHDTFHGITIPVEMEAIWRLEEDWTWLRLRITGIEYNKPELYEE
ncbi:MAG: hypothetical protein K9I94_13555 [Bacteroidales bacterium]|nr:hypothetical protein [Bacteroidales bacterium]